MDQKKSNVVKSKSSNSAIQTKNERANGKNKKTYSNVEVQPPVIKKRGVYVEKKPYKMGIKTFDSPNQTRPDSPTHRSSPPPRRDRKNFLSSVLTILSQNTTSTQYPEETGKQNRRPTSKDVVKKASGQKSRGRLSSPIPSMLSQKQEAKKPKYKSRTLNNNPHEIDQFIVWKKSNTKPSVESASSMDSSKIRIRCDDETECNSPIEKQISEGKQLRSIGKQISEGKQIRSTKMQQRMDLEPVTLISQSRMKDNKNGIYDFFVDLLETTLNVYSVNTEVIDVEANQSKESNVKLEIDKTVADKLNDIANNLTNKPTKIFRIADDYSAETETFRSSVTNSPERSEKIDLAHNYTHLHDSRSPSRLKRSMSPTNIRTSKSQVAKSRAFKSPGKSIYSQSFSYPEKYKNNSQKAQSVVTSNANKKQRKKKTLLGMLKEELSLNDYVYDEPQNLFEALRIMARNKKRSKNIQFADNMEPDDVFTRSDCMKRNKLIPKSLKSRKNKRADDSYQTYGINKSFDRSPTYYKNKSESAYLGDTESYRSLEVYDLDYDYSEPGIRSPSPVKLVPKKTSKRLMKKTIVNAAPSDSSTDVGEDDDKDGTIRKFAETIVNSIHHHRANN